MRFLLEMRRASFAASAKRLAVVLVVSSMIACGGAETLEVEALTPAQAIDLESYRLVDLSYNYDEETLYWPTATRRFELDRESWGQTEGGFFYAAGSFSTPEHGGTHLDAPIHFAAGRETVDRVPLERLIAPVVVIDVAEKAAADPDYRLTVEDVEAWEVRHGKIAAGTAVLLRSGWGARWPNALEYLGDDTPGDASNLHFPSYGAGAARLLVEQRQVALLGVDTASIDHGPSSDFLVHRIANGASVPGLENVANLEAVPATGAWLIALPVKIGGGSGGPARVVALVPRS